MTDPAPPPPSALEPAADAGPGESSAGRGMLLLALLGFVVLGALGAWFGGLGLGAAESGGPTTAPAPTVLALPWLAGSHTRDCAPVSAPELRRHDTAFEGSVTTVATDRVTLAVNHWYAAATGARPASVALTVPSERAAQEFGAPSFSVGERVLVVATAGEVGLCGQSGAWSATLAATYAAAFPGAS